MWWLLACTTPASPSPPRATEGPPGAEVSGAALQDPTGFPRFHASSAPPGPAPDPPCCWSDPERLSAAEGGLRPQIASAPDGTLHVVYYAQTPEGDLLRHRSRAPGQRAWSPPEPIGPTSGRSWGPDLVVRPNGDAVVSYDHSVAKNLFIGRAFSIEQRQGRWSEPEALSEDGDREVGSVHIADLGTDDLVAVWIERALIPGAPFRALSRWRVGGAWGPVTPLGQDDDGEAWHTNVERASATEVVAGWDTGPGGGDNPVWMARGRAGQWSPRVALSDAQRGGERPHFAFDALGAVWAIWFERQQDRPLRVHERGPDGVPSELSQGLGGYHFDPDIARSADGTLCAVWGWDSGSQAELVYSLRRGQGWSRPRLVATPTDKKPGLPSLIASTDGGFDVVWARWVRGDSEVWTSHLAP